MCGFFIASVGVSTWFYVSARTSTLGIGFEWCPSRDPVDYIWEANEPSNGATEYVGMVLLDNRVTRRDHIFADIFPTYPLNFICEVI
jgi:hypothetical protein